VRMSLYIRARFNVRSRATNDFLKVADELKTAALERTGTLAYRWFVHPESGVFISLEEYRDAQAAIDHLLGSTDLLAQIGRSAEMALVECYGKVSPELGELLMSNPKATILPDLPPAG
jgi:quinol monooxygenase YgiN